MSKTAVVTGRVDENVAEKLERLATRLDRSRGWLVARAVEQFVRAESDLLDSLEEADRQIDDGNFYTQQQMEAWVAELRQAR